MPLLSKTYRSFDSVNSIGRCKALGSSIWSSARGAKLRIYMRYLGDWDRVWWDCSIDCASLWGEYPKVPLSTCSVEF